ncbi:MAG TPA: ATP-binding cassette domain-containing protein, partial [Anaerolineae bacterium]|nr:ATP-binding cassette domain-containing protein [Anaerolineae bacterium]
MNSPLVRLERLSYQYPQTETLALYDLSLEIRRGEFVGLIGPTGAGKTTLCLALSGIVPQFYGGRFFGRALVAGMDTVEQPVSA